MKKPVEPTPQMIEAEVQKLIKSAYNSRRWEHYNDIPLELEDCLVSLRLRIHYYEEIYPSVKEYLRTFTKEQIKEIFIKRIMFNTPILLKAPDRATKGVSLFHVTGDTNAVFNGDYLFDDELVSAQDDRRMLSDRGYPIALVFRGNRLYHSTVSKVRYYFSEIEQKTEKSNVALRSKN